MLTLIEILLGLSALYTGGMWLWIAITTWPLRHALKELPENRKEIADFTFRLGLCFVLSIGFLGLIAGGQ